MTKAEKEPTEYCCNNCTNYLPQLEAELQAAHEREKEAKYIIPEGDERCGFTLDACQCMKRKDHDGLHACAHGGWRAEVSNGR